MLRAALPALVLPAAFVAAIGAAVAQTGPAPAAREADACAAYAARSVDQQNENIARKCGFNGADWSTDWQAHFDFCKRSEAAAVKSAVDARTAALRDKCLVEVCETRREKSFMPPFFKSETVCRRVPR